MMVLLRWTGWNKKEKEELPLLALQQQHNGKTIESILSTLRVT